MSDSYIVKELHTKEELLSSWELVFELYPEMSKNQYAEYLDSMIQKDYHQLIVLDGSKIVGLSGYWFGTKLWCGKYLEMDNVVVTELYRGKGVAKILSERLYDIAETNSCKMICLDAYTDNLPALKFYVKEGFVPRGFHYIKHI